MYKTWRWLGLGATAVALAAVSLLGAGNTTASGGGASPTPGLPNTNWTLVSLNGQAPIAGRALTLRFLTDGQLSGHSGCNSFGGQYVVGGGSLAVSQMISTLRACAEQPLNDQEATYQQALNDATQLGQAGTQLTLKNASGGEVLVFQKQ